MIAEKERTGFYWNPKESRAGLSGRKEAVPSSLNMSWHPDRTNIRGRVPLLWDSAKRRHRDGERGEYAGDQIASSKAMFFELPFLRGTYKRKNWRATGGKLFSGRLGLPLPYSRGKRRGDTLEGKSCKIRAKKVTGLVRMSKGGMRKGTGNSLLVLDRTLSGGLSGGKMENQRDHAPR